MRRMLGRNGIYGWACSALLAVSLCLCLLASAAQAQQAGQGGGVTFVQLYVLAKDHGLMEIKGTNSHLNFQDGDITWWCKQQLTKAQYQEQFSARAKALDELAVMGKSLKDQGDLSAYVNGKNPSLKFAVKNDGTCPQ